MNLILNDEIVGGRLTLIHEGFSDCSIEIEGRLFLFHLFPTALDGIDVVVDVD